MTFYQRALLLLALLSTMLPFSSTKLHAESTRDLCARTSQDNASFRRCVIDKTISETVKLTGKACSSKRCLIKMPCEQNKRSTVCEAAGYKVTIIGISSGSEIEVL